MGNGSAPSAGRGSRLPAPERGIIPRACQSWGSQLGRLATTAEHTATASPLPRAQTVSGDPPPRLDRAASLLILPASQLAHRHGLKLRRHAAATPAAAGCVEPLAIGSDAAHVVAAAAATTAPAAAGGATDSATKEQTARRGERHRQRHERAGHLGPGNKFRGQGCDGRAGRRRRHALLLQPFASFFFFHGPSRPKNMKNASIGSKSM